MSKARQGPGRMTEAVIRASAYVHDAPATFTYLFLVGVTTVVTQSLPGNVVRSILRSRSTNLVQIRQNPVRALVASAFWISGPQNYKEYVFWAILYAIIVARTEQWLGPLRTTAVFFAAHIGATLFTLAGAAFAISHGFAPSRLARVIDVGVSYGFAGVAAIYAYRLRGRIRMTYMIGLIALFLAGLILFGGYGDVGHFLALGIGFALYRLTKTPKGARAVIATR